MLDTANRDCRILFDVLMGQGIRDIVLSPGSRNAPLLTAASVRQELNKHIIADERTAAFFALGIAVAKQKPVMLACTSGTALYNYAPAVAEAYYQHIPLIIVSADRPARWIDQDDSQTLRQNGALQNIVKRNFNIALAEGESIDSKGFRFNDEREWYVNRTVNEAWIAATSGLPGPVHINIQFDIPLGKTIDIEPENPRLISLIQNPNSLPPHIIGHLANTVKGKKILITAGFMQPDNKLNNALQELLRLPNVAICAEPISNIHLTDDCFMIDSVLSPKDPKLLADLQPDIVISIGGALISRFLKEFLRQYQPSEHWTLNDTDYGVDMFQSLTTHIECNPGYLFHLLAKKLSSVSESAGSDYSQRWKEARLAAKMRMSSYIKNIGWSELKAFGHIFSHLPLNFNLFLSNGTPVRYGALLIEKIPHACYGNRGVSGIDGTNSTALGIAVSYPSPTLLITGDLSFSYAPQIMGLPYVTPNFKIIVINNHGGGIFRFITSTRSLNQREEYFCADTPQPLSDLAKAYNWQYFFADSEETLVTALHTFFSCKDKPALMEIKVDPQVSADALINLLRVD